MVDKVAKSTLVGVAVAKYNEIRKSLEVPRTRRIDKAACIDSSAESQRKESSKQHGQNVAGLNERQQCRS